MASLLKINIVSQPLGYIHMHKGPFGVRIDGQGSNVPAI